MKRIDEFRGRYYFLSNFSHSPLEYKGLVYQNGEAAFQAMKVIDEKRREQFTNLPPNRAKAKGRNVKLRGDWEHVKEQVMYEVVRAKIGRASCGKGCRYRGGTEE